MSNPERTFGETVASLSSVTEFLEWEVGSEKAERFGALDALVDNLVVRSLRGELIVKLVRASRRNHLQIEGLSDEQRHFVEEWCAVERQQARGAWFLPDDASLKVGWLSLPFYFQQYPRYATGVAFEERGRVAFGESADAVLIWSILQPMSEELFRPFELRGPQVGKLSHEKQLQAWDEIERFYDALEIDVTHELTVMRYGGGWSQLRASEQLAAKQQLMWALQREVCEGVAARYRARQLQKLIARYYRQAKKGPPTRRRVVTKTFQPILSGYFAGDWLALLEYLDEEPHPEERVVTGLPEPHVFIGEVSQVAAVAAEHGLPVDEVERMLGSFWGGNQEAAPVQQRVAALQDYWGEFDAIHAQQQSGMSSLWGLVDDMGFILRSRSDLESTYRPGLYRELLSPDLLSAIDRLWGSCMLPRWPESIVSEPSPQHLMAETFGPALTFWHGCALTAWFICEGPYSRTDLAGLASYHDRELEELAQLGCPVDSSLFSDLLNAEQRLGLPEPVTKNVSQVHAMQGATVTFEMTLGTRRDGFHHLRDVITRYRRGWSEAYLEQYLRARWEIQLRELATEYSRLLEERGRPPTLKQFARKAARATNHWFGGETSSLYAAIGEKISIQPERKRLMPADTKAFAWIVFEELGGEPLPPAPESVGRLDHGHPIDAQRYWNLVRLAEESPRYIQLEEALGRPPELREFGKRKFEWPSSSLASDIEEAWAMYQAAVEMAKVVPIQPRVQRQQPLEIVDTAESDLIKESADEQKLDPDRKQPSFWKRLIRRS